MHHKIRSAGICGLILVWAALALTLWFGPKEDYTYAERRKLAQMPEISMSKILSGKFMPEFEDFTLDQFPLRDNFRQLKSLFHYYGLRQADNNGIYLVDDMVAKLEFPVNSASVDYALGRFQHIYDTYLKESGGKIFAAMIPDKGYFLAEQNGYPAMDYAALEQRYQKAMPWAEYVPLAQHLSVQDYYRTDTHWRQECILPVAQALCEKMGVQMPKPEDYRQKTLETPFYGVYFGQAALPLKPEPLHYLTSDLLEGCTVTDPVSGKQTPVYNLEKEHSPDPYEVFLSGAQPLLTIDNPAGKPGRELILFRDSYSSSLTPLLLADYSKVTLVDIRYIGSDQVGQFVDFHGQDVLFLYSTLILNNGRSLK